MASHPTERKIRRGQQPRLAPFSRVFASALHGIIKNDKSNVPTLEVTVGGNLSSQNSESTIKQAYGNHIQSKPVVHSENSRVHRDKSCKSVDRNSLLLKNDSDIQDSCKKSSNESYSNKKQHYVERKQSHELETTVSTHEEESENWMHRNKSCKSVNQNSSPLKKDSNTQDNCNKSSNEAYSNRKQNYVERVQSHGTETKVSAEEEESEDYIEFSEIKHQRKIEISNKAFTISLKNELPSETLSPVPNIDSPPPPAICSLPPTSSVCSLSSDVSPVCSLPPTSPVCSLPPTSSVCSLSSDASPICSLPPTSTVCSLYSASPVCSLPPASTVCSLSSASPACSSLHAAQPVCSLPLPQVYSFPPPASPLYSLPPPDTPSHVSENSNLTDYNSAHVLLPSGDDCLIPPIPPPVLPSTINSDSSSTSSERKNSSLSNGLDSLGDEMPDENEFYPTITDPEHFKAITNYILTVVKERAVSGSSAIRVVRDLNLLFKNYFEGNIIEIYGSYDTELAITTSDINLVVLADISLKKSFMFEIYKVLAKELEKYHVHPYEEGISAHQTKINFSHPDTGINCQLAYLGKHKENVFKMGNYLKLMARIHQVKTLIIATKIWAECLAINEVEDGKLHPVGYALLVIHFLQHCENPVLPIFGDSCDNKVVGKHPPNALSIGELWMDFLKYFSKFNWKQNVVTVKSKKVVSKKSKHWENYWMAIEDPFTGKNVAESIVNSDVAEYIQSCFKSSYTYFSNPSEKLSVCSSNEDFQNNGESPNCKYEFSFQQCIAEQSDALCERCEEIDDICNECKKKIYVHQPMASIPKMTDSFLSKIKEALMTVYNKYILSEKEINERKQFVEDLQRSVCKVYPDAQMNLFGSSTNGFGFKNSDLDICITFKTKKINSGSVLKDIRRLLRKDKGFDHVVIIFNAQIPIIKFHYKPKEWRGDISLDNTLAVHNSELLHTYSLIDERCKILGCALKLLAKKALVAEVTEKALSSYSYLVMVIHFLQQIEPPVLPILQDNTFRENNFRLDHIVENCNIWFCKDLDYIEKVFKKENVASVEQLWLDLLDYYCFFYSNHFITIRQKETQYIKDMKRSSRLFNIQDPFIETKNLGCVVSAKKAQETKSIFNRARQLFRTPVKELPSSVKDIEDYFFSTMSLTGRIHKEAHCNLCGKFGHEQTECKQSCFPLRRPNFGQFKKYNIDRNRSANTSKFHNKFYNKSPIICETSNKCSYKSASKTFGNDSPLFHDSAFLNTFRRPVYRKQFSS